MRIFDRRGSKVSRRATVQGNRRPRSKENIDRKVGRKVESREVVEWMGER